MGFSKDPDKLGRGLICLYFPGLKVLRDLYFVQIQQIFHQE